MKINAPEACGLLKKAETVIDQNLCDGIAVHLLTWQLIAGHDARVLVQARTFVALSGNSPLALSIDA